MKILFSISYYTPYVSGLTLYVKRLAEELQKTGYQVSVVSNKYKQDLKEQETVNGVEIIRAKPLLAISKGFLSLDFILKSFQLVQENDTVIVNLPQFEGIFLAFFAKIFGKKLITVYHCEVKLPGSLINLFIETTLNVSNWLTLLLSDSVVTYTEDFARHSLVLSLFLNKIKIIYPPIKKPIVNKRVQKLIRDKIGGKPRFLIGVAARLAAEKGIEYLFEALPQIISNFHPPAGGSKKQIKIVIAGSMEPVGEQMYKEKILTLVEKYKEHIVFLGELPEEEMGSFYSILDVLVLPSVNSTESFGMVQVEAMMMGVPVVASDLPGVRLSVIKTGMGKIVPIKDNQKLAEAIVELLVHKDKYIKNRESIIKEFSFEKTINFYLDLFRFL